jgi:excinuclease ABC subunit C
MVDLSNIPNSPGIYIFKDVANHPIYIGKAINLRARVRSYWLQNSWRDRPKLAVLVPQISDIETIITKNEKEALILEASLIYKHQPKYNVLLKDNKSFPWIAITYGEPFPRLVPVRDLKWIKKKFPKAKLFGPYTDTGDMYRTLGSARELFPLRKRQTPLFRDRPCLNFYLGQCLAPCQAKISQEDYNVLLKQVELFLTGKHQDLISELEEKMIEASGLMHYERAGKYRDQIKLLRRSVESQSIISDDPDCERDLIGFACSNSDMCVQIFKMRGGKLVGREGYDIILNEVQTIPEAIESTIEQAYLLRLADDIPGEVFLQDEIQGCFQSLSTATVENRKMSERLGSLLGSFAKKSVSVIFPKRGEKKEQVELAAYNALQQLQSQQKQKTKALLSLETLRDALNLEITPIKIDCFDISHLGGTEVVASCVRLKEAFPDKSMYRKIKLSIDQNNDFFSMREAVYRRYHRSHPDKEINLPDLIVIDGGKGQLGAALEALTELGLQDDVALISLAKREEEIYTPTGDKIVLPKSSPALQVVQRVRDEAHRFAVTYNRTRRSKSMKQSFIDEIPGIGESMKERIKKNFTLKELLKAPPQEIDAKIRVGAKRADRIWQLVQGYSRRKGKLEEEILEKEEA